MANEANKPSIASTPVVGISSEERERLIKSETSAIKAEFLKASTFLVSIGNRFIKIRESFGNRGSMWTTWLKDSCKDLTGISWRTALEYVDMATLNAKIVKALPEDVREGLETTVSTLRKPAQVRAFHSALQSEPIKKQVEKLVSITDVKDREKARKSLLSEIRDAIPQTRAKQKPQGEAHTRLTSFLEVVCKKPKTVAEVVKPSEDEEDEDVKEEYKSYTQYLEDLKAFRLRVAYTVQQSMETLDVDAIVPYSFDFPKEKETKKTGTNG
jgi:hypothetical protein